MVSNGKLPITKKYFLIFKDDLVVPYMLGERLYQAALAKRPLDAKPVNFVSFESELGKIYIFFGINYIILLHFFIYII